MWGLVGLLMWVLLVSSVVGGVAWFMLIHFSLDFSVGLLHWCEFGFG